MISREQGRGDAHSSGAELPRRQDREVRQADEGREGRRDARRPRSSSAKTRRTKRCAARTSTPSSKCSKSRSSKLPELTPSSCRRWAASTTKASCATRSRKTCSGSWNITSSSRPPADHRPLLTEAADWELPPDLLQRQSRRELERAVLELRRSGFSDAEIRAHENELRQNSAASTARAFKEHFILERIAEEEKIDAEPDDYDDEIRLIAAQSGESAAARAGSAGKARPDGHAAKPDHRAQGDRAGAVARQVQGRALSSRKAPTPRRSISGRRRGRGVGHSRGQARRSEPRSRSARRHRPTCANCWTSYTG